MQDEERAAAIEKVKGYITRFGGTVTNVDEWGKKRLVHLVLPPCGLWPLLSVSGARILYVTNSYSSKESL